MSNPDILNVWYENILVGEIWLDPSGLMGFKYDQNWLEKGFPISHQMPIQKEPFIPSESIAHKYFANLLPEEGARRRIVKELKLTDTDFNLLKAVGSECAGALSVLPSESEHNQSVEYTDALNDDVLKNIILRKGRFLKDVTKEPLQRLSLAGAQDKCLVYYAKGKFYLPKSSAPSTHIMKFELSDYKNIPAYEYFLSQLAKSTNIPVVNCELKKLGKAYYLLIARYDRIKSNGKIKRLHQEDFCQALGISYAKKYENDGGPTFLDCYNILQEVSTFPLKDLEHLLKWQIFNVLAGNSDGHAKNISIIYDKNNIRLAPFYDLVCTRAIDGIDHKLALSVAGEFEPSKVNVDKWLMLANECGVKEKFMVDIIKQMAQDLLGNAESIRSQFEEKFGFYQALERVQHVIEKQCRKILKSI